MRLVVSGSFGLEFDAVFQVRAAIAYFGERACNGLPADGLAHRAAAPKYAQIGHGLCYVVQQRGIEHHVRPLVTLGINLLDWRICGQKMRVAPGHGRKHHLQGMGQQPAGVGMMMGFGRRHQLHVLGIAVDGGQQVALEHDFGKARLVPHLAHCFLGLDQPNEFIGLQHAQPALLLAANIEGMCGRCRDALCAGWPICRSG